MKTILGLVPFALGLAACQAYPNDPYYPGPGPGPYPAPYPGPPVDQGDYRAVGTEPFWDLTIGRDMVFTDRGTNFTVSEPTPPVRHGVAGEIYQGRRINVNIVHSRCSDGMSDRSYPDTVQVRVDGREYRGCGANAAFFYAQNEGGSPNPPQGAFNLANTNWRVASINGQPVSPSGYYLNFSQDRLSGRFGCNSLSGTYTVAGSILSAGPLAMTRMACPNGSLETQGAAVLAKPVTLTESGDRLTLSNNSGAIDLIRAR